MSTKISETKLIQNEKDHSRFLDLFLLKSAAEWLEKQNWISSPYGGENYLEDMIFRIKMLSGQEWNAIFQDGNVPANLQQVREYFEMLKTIDPEIKTFYDGVQKQGSSP
jgi:hypothetical protein